MILDLRELEDFPVKVTLRAQPGEFKPFAEEVTAVEEVRLDLAIQHSGHEYFCQGKLQASYLVECSRCLASYEQSVTQQTDFIVCGVDQKQNLGDVDDVEDYVFLKGNELVADVSEPVRQALVLSLGMKPLCSEECRGLCVKCGINLNEGECDCVHESIDPRWKDLEKLSGDDS